MKNVIVLLAIFFSYNHSSAQISKDSIENISDSIFDKYLNAREYLTGGVISVVNADSIVFIKGYGSANREKEIPFDPYQTIVEASSVTKLITTTALLQLVEKGVIEIDAPIKDYLKDLTYKNPFDNKVTVKHLLTHTGGFDDRNNFMSSKSPEDVPTLEQYANNHIPSVIWEPGKFFNYSNYSFVLAAYLVQKVSKMPFEIYVKNNILIPLEMGHSGFGYNPSLAESLMIPYRLRENNENEIYTQKADTEYTNLIGASGFKTTDSDMANFMIMYLNEGSFKGKQILKRQTIEEAFKTQFTYDKSIKYQQGLGWRILIKNGKRVLYQYGDDTGVESSLVLFPDHKIGLFTAFNNPVGYNVKTELQSKLFDALNNGSRDEEITYKVSTPIERITGAYFYMNDSHTTFEKIAFLLGDRKIMVEAADSSTITIGSRKYKETSSPQLFHEINGDSEVKFIMDEDGDIGYYSYGTSTFRKISKWEDPSLHLTLLFGCIIVFLILLLTSIIRFFIYKFGKKESPVKTVTLNYINLNDLFILLFIAGIAIVSKTSTLAYGVQLPVKFVFIFPILATLAFPFSLYFYIKNFDKYTTWLKVLMLVNLLSLIICLTIFSTYNLLGFHFV